MSIYIDLKNSTDYSKLHEAANIIKNGGIVLFPTETVYGLGANGLDSNSVQKVFYAKGRDYQNPVNLLVSDMKMVEMVAKNISDLEYKLMNTFFPGPFTIVLQKTDIVPSIVTANHDTVGIRMPSGIIARKLVEFSSVPIAAPSANLSGKPSGTILKNIYNDFKDKVDCMIDGGDSSIGIESTIVKVVDNIPHILRPGSITLEQIEKVCGIKPINDYKTNPSNIPSNKFKHYSLNSKSIVVYSNNNEIMVSKISEIASNYTSPVILCSHSNVNKYNFKYVIDIGNNLEEIGKNIFAYLKQVDNISSDIIIIEGVKQEGIGIAIMDRLIKACENNFVEI